MVPRFYAPLLRRDDGEVALPPDEASHLARVLRLEPGAPVRVFDGRGLERAATVAHVTKSAAILALGDVVAAAPEPGTVVTLGQALLKADKFDGVIRDATMLGVAAIRPLASARSDVPPAAARAGGRADRWRRVAVASAKQCGRAVVPDVSPAVDLAACLAADASSVRLMLAEPSLASGDGAPPGLNRELVAGAPSVLVLVGPEGGWSDDEAAQARAAGCQLVTLGRRTLRADAAPLVALSVLLHLLGDL